MVDAERIAEETPALPGDVVDYGSGYRRLVRHAALVRTSDWRDDPVYEYVVHVEAEDPVPVIMAGGGTCLVLPIEPLHEEWPPRKAQVLRNGVLVYDNGNRVA